MRTTRPGQMGEDFAGEQFLDVTLYMCVYCRENVYPTHLTQDGRRVCNHCHHKHGPFLLQDLEKEPACAVPFAYRPGTSVTEKFTVEIKTPESPDYCGCERCRTARAEFWTVLIEHKLQHFADHSDPLRVFPEKHKIKLRPHLPWHISAVNQ